MTNFENQVRAKNICSTDRLLTIPALMPLADLANAGSAVVVWILATSCIDANQLNQVKIE